MIQNIYYFSQLLAYLGDIFLFLLSLWFCYRPYNPPFLRIFPIYCFVAMTADLINWTMSKSWGMATYHIYDLFELPFLSFFFGRLLKSKTIKKLMIVLNIAFLFCYLYLILKFGLTHNMYWPTLAEPFLLLIPYFTWFREMLMRKEISDISHEPQFWFVTGFLFYAVCFIPTIFFLGYFNYYHKDNIATGIYSMNNFAGIITDLLCIKGMTCRIPR